MQEYHVGITATKTGMSERQQSFLAMNLTIIRDCHDVEVHFHHGDCIGGDEQGHEIAHYLGCKIHIHPPTNPKYRAFCDVSEAHMVYPVAPYLVRDRAIVDAIKYLYAGPKDENKEELRSGTWTTVRYARKKSVPYLLLPR